MNANRPWMTALEMQFAAMKIVTGNYSDNWRGGLLPRERDYLKVAETFAWSEDTVAAATFAAKSLPLTSHLPIPLPTPVAWWWFEKPILRLSIPRLGMGGSGADKHLPPAKISVKALLVAIEGSVVHFRAFCPLNNELLVDPVTGVIDNSQGPIGSWVSWTVGLDETLEQHMERATTQVKKESQPLMLPAYETMTRFVFAACAWLQQHIVVWASGSIERHRRKQLAREHNIPAPSEVKVIELRRRESQPHGPRSEGAEVIDWCCRWIVSGHWRNQYHPSTGQHQLKYILPFVKGPADKPLRVPTHTVYAVNR